jgi:hypothetical protein
MLDQEMREPLFDFLEEYFGKIRTIEEKVILGSRADVLGVLDGKIAGFEIKSDHDTYTRLKTQMKDYEKFCNLCYVVVGKSHLAHVAEHIPKYWGIICVASDTVTMEREAQECPKVKMAYQIQLLWRMELNQLLQQNEMPKYKDRGKKFVQEKLLLKIEPEELMRQITDTLFERDYTIFDDTGTAVRYRKTKKGIKVKRPRGRKKL